MVQNSEDLTTHSHPEPGAQLPFCRMTDRPEEEERRAMGMPEGVLLESVNSIPGRRKLLSASDCAYLVKIISHNEEAWNQLMKRADIPKAKTGELVAFYNEKTGKDIKRFADRATAEAAVKKLIPPEPRVPKAAKEPKAPKANGTGATRGRPFIDHLLQATGTGETNVRETSKRGQVLATVATKKAIRRSELNRAMGFETSGYVQKLVEMKHIQVVEEAAR